MGSLAISPGWAFSVGTRKDVAVATTDELSNPSKYFISQTGGNIATAAESNKDPEGCILNAICPDVILEYVMHDKKAIESFILDAPGAAERERPFLAYSIT